MAIIFKPKKRNPKLKRAITPWACGSKAFMYYLIWGIFWIFLYNKFFTARDFFRSLDVLFYPKELFNELPRALICLSLGGMAIYGVDVFVAVVFNMFYRLKKLIKFIEQIGSSCGIDGVQGIGKTRLILFMGMVLQYDKWIDLLYNYYIQCPIEDKLKKNYDENILPEEYIRFKAQKESVEAYKSTPEFIPLIYSNIRLYHKGKVPRPLVREHFTQDERLYESNIKLASELDNILPNTLRKVKDSSKDELKANAIDEFVGLDRQYTNGTLISDTHRNGALYLPVRDCQQVRITLLTKKYMYTPKFLKFCYTILHKHVVEKTQENTKLFLRKICKWLEAQIKSIGFTKLPSIIKFGDKAEEIDIVLPNQVPFSYNDRILQQDYLALGYREQPKPAVKDEKQKKRKKNDEAEKAAL